MNFEEVKQAVSIENSRLLNTTVTLNPAAFAGLNKVFQYCYGNNPIVISNATLQAVNEAGRTITINGRAHFENIPDLPVRLVIGVTQQSEIQVTLYYQLIGETRPANPWTFSRSFPNLPTVVDGNQPTLFDRRSGKVSQSFVVPLDTLYLTDTYFVVTNIPHHDENFNIDLKWGLNFCSHLRPTGLLSVVEHLFNSTNQLVIYGTIRRPYNNETKEYLQAKYTAPSPDGHLYPWDVESDFTDSLPGIFLKAPLGLNYSVINNKLNFKGEYLYFYTPLTAEYALKSTTPQFMPVQAYAGSIEIKTSNPTDDLKLSMVAPVIPGASLLQLHGRFKNFSLKNIGQLTGLTGSNSSPLQFLPDEIKKLGDELGKLELQAASIIVDYTDLEYIDLSYASFTIGMKELNWEIWQDHFTIRNIGCTFNIDYPLSTETDPDEMFSRQMEVTVFGRMAIEGVDFDVIAKNSEDFTVYAQMSKAETIPLSSIIKKYASGITPPGDLTINTFRLGVSPFKSYSFAMAMAQQPNPWKIDLGPQELTVYDVAMGINYANGKATGAVSGTVSIGDNITLFLNYSTPGNIAIRSYIAEVKLKQLIGRLSNQLFALPDAFDITLTQNSILIQKEGSNYTFMLATNISGWGLMAFQVQKMNGKWGAAFGIDMGTVKLSGLPGLSALSVLEELFPLEQLTLVASSFEAPGFSFPNTAKFNNPALGTKDVQLPAGTNKLVAGMNFYGKFKFENASRELTLLRMFLGISKGTELDVAVQVSKQPAALSKVFVHHKTNIQGHVIECAFGAMQESGLVSSFLTGEMDFHLGGQLLKCNITLLFVPNGAFIAATVEGIVDLSVFKLCDLSLQIGIDWEGIPSLGFAGTIVADRFKSSIAVFFNSVNPAQSMIAGSVSDLTLADVFNTFTGLNESSIDKVLNEVQIKGTHNFVAPNLTAADLDNRDLEKIAATCKGQIDIPTATSQSLFVVGKPGEAWFITVKVATIRHYAFRSENGKINVSTEAQFCYVPVTTHIGALEFKKQFYINAAIKFFGFEASMVVDIDPDKGIAVDGKMSKMIIGHPNIFSLSAARGDGGPEISISTYQNDKHEVEKFRQPHFYVNGQLTMLGMHYEAYVNMTESGGEFDIKVSLLGLVKGSLAGVIKNFDQMDVTGTLNVGIGDIDLGKLGTFSIDTGAAASMRIFVTPKSMGVSFGLVFKLAGEEFNLGTLTLNVQTGDLSKLPEVIFEAIKNFLEKLFTDPEEWARMAKSAINWTHDQITGVLKDQFGLSPEAAEVILAIVFPVCAMTTALVNM